LGTKAGVSKTVVIGDAKVTKIATLSEVTLKVLEKAPGLSPPDIIQIFLMHVSFPFKTYFVIGLIRIAIFYEPNKVFKEIPNEEKDDKQLQLLL
jgi:hypothetical protein